MLDKALLSCPQRCKQNRAGAQSHIISLESLYGTMHLEEDTGEMIKREQFT